jgi:hypothetical protein
MEEVRMMKLVVAVVFMMFLASSAFGLETQAYQMREDYGTEPLYDCALQYYYYIPCPTDSWFWGWSGWSPGDIVGAVFMIGEDPSMGGFAVCDSVLCQELETIRVLDFAGYGTVYPGLYTVEFEVYCADPATADGCPQYVPAIWNSGPYETHYGWNYIPLDPPLCLSRNCCNIDDGPPPMYPYIIICATHTGSDSGYPAWGTDNISTPLGEGCGMYDIGGNAAVYPRPAISHYGSMHSGYYGNGAFLYCPPICFCDPGDTTEDCSEAGCVELAWTIYMICGGPTATQPSTWGSIKSIYK